MVNVVLSPEIDLHADKEAYYNADDLMRFSQRFEANTGDTGKDSNDEARNDGYCANDLRNPVHFEREFDIESEGDDSSGEDNNEGTDKERRMYHDQVLEIVWLCFGVEVCRTVNDRIEDLIVLGLWHVCEEDTVRIVFAYGDVGVIRSNWLTRSHGPNPCLMGVSNTAAVE